MRNKNLIRGVFVVAVTSLMVSCGGSGEDELQNIVVEDTATADIIIDESAIEFSVPTPNELFAIVKLEGGEEKVGLVHSLEARDSYIELKEKALNFGVYSADLAYLSCFGIGTEFLKYFKSIQEIGEELGIEGAFDEDLMDRIENNEGDTDSLFSISNDSYYDSYLYLEENDKGVELSLIMVGGYIESLYIITSLVDEFDETNPIIEKIGDQKVVLEQILDFILEFSDDANVSEVMDDLLSLADVFETSMEFEESGTNIDSDNGTLMLSGGGSFKMTADALNDITSKVNELRNDIIK